MTRQHPGSVGRDKATIGYFFTGRQFLVATVPFSPKVSADARITITPHWATIHDFETRLPSAVEELPRQQQ